MSRNDYEWLSWNPVTGCTKISSGCLNCYAERLANYVQSLNPQGKYRNGFKLTLHPEYLDVPLKYKNPRIFFVNSMSDLFHKDVPFDFILKVFNRMERAYWHSYRILTKRPERMRYFINEIYRKVLPNLWLGTSIESNKYLYRLEELKQTNAKIKFVNFAPLIGSIGQVNLEGINWVFIGGERSFKNKPRQMKVEWIAEIVEQCKRYNVPFYLSSGHSKLSEETIEDIYEEYPSKEPQKNILEFT